MAKQSNSDLGVGALDAIVRSDPALAKQRIEAAERAVETAKQQLAWAEKALAQAKEEK